MDLQTLSNLIGKQHPVGKEGNLGWIELVDMMPHPQTLISGDNAIVSAARVSYLGESKGPDKDESLIYYLMGHRHTSPFEQVEFKFRVKAPTVTWWHWVRHRTWNFNSQSGRYTPFKDDEHYTPHRNEWRIQSKTNHQGSSGNILGVQEQRQLIEKLFSEIDTDDTTVMDLFEKQRMLHVTGDLTDLLNMWTAMSYQVYEACLEAGIAKEMARYFLPAWVSYYTMVVKIDAHNLLHFLRLRMAEGAQYEIRAFADVIWNDIFKVALPITSQAAEYYGIIQTENTPEENKK